METKNDCKVIKIDFDREWTPPGADYTIFYFNSEWENDIKGFFTTNKRDQTKFEVDKSYNITLEDKVNKKGDKSIKIDTVKENKGGGYKYDSDSQAQIERNNAIRFAIETVMYSDMLSIDMLKPLTRDYATWIAAKSKDKQSSWNAIGAINQAVQVLQIVKNADGENKMNCDEILEFADKFYKFISKGKASE